MNKFCPHCKVYVKSDLTNCPICGKYLGESEGQTFSSYVADLGPPPYRRSHWLNLTISAVILFTVLCALVNVALCIIYKRVDEYFLWGIFVIIAALITLFCVLYPIKRQRFRFIDGVIAYILVCAAILSADFLSNFHVGFSIAYVLPSLTLGEGVVCVVYTFFKKGTDLGNYFLGLLVSVVLLAGLGILDTLLWFNGVLQANLLPLYIEIAVSIVLFVFMLATRFKEYAKNLIKKFHI